MADKILTTITNGQIVALQSSDQPLLKSIKTLVGGDFTFILGDAIGVNKFYVVDSSSGILFSVDTLGTVNTKHLILANDNANPPLSITARAAAPTAPAAGDIYLDDGTNTASTKPGFRRYTGTAWEDIGAIGGGGGGSVGGLYGINVETLSANKTLVANTDVIYQYLTISSSYTVYLSNTGAVAGDRFVIKNNASYNSSRSLGISIDGSDKDRIYSRTIRTYIFNGTTWIASVGTSLIGEYNAAFGYNAKGYDYGAAFGYNASGVFSGAAFGHNANGATDGAAFGYNASGYNFGVAVGTYTATNNNYYSIALGYFSQCIRYGEFYIGGDAVIPNKSGTGQLILSGSTTTATVTELFIRGTASNRLTIQASSALTFKIMVTAIGATTFNAAAYKFEGVIKRDNANTTSIVGTPVKTVLAEDDTTWDCDIVADDTNDALVLNVTGTALETVKWVAKVEYAEVII